MRTLLLAGTSLLALSASLAAASAVPTTTVTPPGLQTYTVEDAGLYEIIALGAQGGSAGTDAGGLGAKISGEFELAAGETLHFAVGGMGDFHGGAGGTGGGGGSGGGYYSHGAPL